MKIIEKIKNNMFLRNAILAVCVLIIMIFLAQISLSLLTRHGQVRNVPDFSGKSMKEAEKLAQKASLKLEINDSLYFPSRPGGTILEQTPSSGAKVKSGRRIFVTINSYNPKTAIIPFVAGFSLRQAKNNLEVAGFEIERLVYTDDIATNNVIQQKYQGKTITSNSNITAPQGSSVVLVVGINGAVSAKVPKIVGFPLKEAKSRLWDLGLNVGKITMDKNVTDINVNDARVYRQTPNAGSILQLGSSVDIFLTLDTDKTTSGGKSADAMAKEIAKKNAADAAISAETETAK